MKKNPTVPVLIVGFGGLLLYVLLILVAHTDVQFDEPIHLGSVLLLDQYGFGPEFLRHLPAGPGPLYPLLHRALEPLTGLKTPWVRLVNPVIFLGIIFLMNGFGKTRWLGINLMGLPFIAINIGLALTEIPAMFCVTASLLFLFRALEDEKISISQALAWGLAGGLCFGLAMWGRQTYIIALPAFLALWKTKRQFFVLALFGITALAMIVPIFLVWKGLVPPFDQGVETGFRPDHGFFAFAFVGLATLIIEPRFFIMPWRWFWSVAVVTGVTNFIFKLAEIAPMDHLTRKYLPHELLPLWGTFCSTLFACLAATTLVAYGRQLWQSRRQPQVFFALLAAGLILFGCTRMIQSISSRYVTTAIPFWLISLQPLIQNDRTKPYRFAAAITVGAVLLWSYLHPLA